MNRWLPWIAGLLLPDPPRRYRVTPRQNPFELRRQLRRNIRSLLRRGWRAGDFQP